jgi:hypothetical protein
LRRVAISSTRIRLAVEAELRRLGWPLAEGPSSADVLVVVGECGDGPQDWLEQLYDGMPWPRARVDVKAPNRVADVLHEGYAARHDGLGDRGSRHSNREQGIRHPGDGQGRVMCEPDSEIRRLFGEEVDPVEGRYLDVLTTALPHLPRHEVVFRWRAMMGLLGLHQAGTLTDLSPTKGTT